MDIMAEPEIKPPLSAIPICHFQYLFSPLPQNQQELGNKGVEMENGNVEKIPIV